MNLIELLARSAIAKWQRFTQYLESTSRVQDSIQLIHEIRNAVLTCGFTDRFDRAGTLQARALKGLTPSRLRVARGVAAAIGISLFMPMHHASSGSINAIQSIRLLADYQLTEKQEYCHNQIVYRESRFNRLAVNGSHYGYYQGKSKVLKNASNDYQFYWYWAYVSDRYGVTRYDEPDMCKALHHLRVKGWQ